MADVARTSSPNCPSLSRISDPFGRYGRLLRKRRPNFSKIPEGKTIMMRASLIPQSEFDARMNQVKQVLAQGGMDVGIVTSAENIFYLTGLDHQGYFGPHALAVRPDGETLLFARAHEQTTVNRQVKNSLFVGYPDTASPGAFIAEHLKSVGLGDATIGIQGESLGFPPAFDTAVRAGLPEVQWSDISGLVERFRLVKSDNEVFAIRKAAAVSDACMETALSVAKVGINEQAIAAEVHKRMFEIGGEYVGFGPFIRSGERLPYEHEVWTDRAIGQGEQLLLEMAGCVGRYHAPMGRLAFAGKAPAGTHELAEICIAAQDRVLEAMRPGATGADVYNAWQSVIDEAGLTHYRRHHCGYAVGIAFPPTWTGGIGVVSMHPESDLVLECNMVFHQLSWLLGCGRGDYFVSDTVLVGESGGERLTTASRDVVVL